MEHRSLAPALATRNQHHLSPTTVADINITRAASIVAIVFVRKAQGIAWGSSPGLYERSTDRLHQLCPTATSIMHRQPQPRSPSNSFV